ncbi:MAG TPA: hypothetical protein VGB74_10000 [Actinoplanes sp.]|jgi:hypothetical protein
MTEPTVLFLCTARNDEHSVAVLAGLAAALRGRCRVEAVSDLRNLRSLETGADLVDLIPAAAPHRIAAAAAIVLHISAEDIDVPDFPYPRPGPVRAEDVADAFAEQDRRPIPGRGLLRKIDQLHRLGRLPDTVVVCDGRYQPVLDDLIVLGGMSRDATDERGNAVTPRLTADDRELGHLREAFCGITYRPDGAAGRPLPRLAAALCTAVEEILARRPPG